MIGLLIAWTLWTDSTSIGDPIIIYSDEDPPELYELRDRGWIEPYYISDPEEVPEVAEARGYKRFFGRVLYYHTVEDTTRFARIEYSDSVELIGYKGNTGGYLRVARPSLIFPVSKEGEMVIYFDNGLGKNDALYCCYIIVTDPSDEIRTHWPVRPIKMGFPKLKKMVKPGREKKRGASAK